VLKKQDFGSDEEVLYRIKNGDTEVWNAAIEEFYKPLYYFVVGMVRHAEDAEELVQDVFVNFWAKREHIDIQTSLKAYLYRAARNHSLNFLKRKAFEANYQRQVAQNMEVSHSNTERDVQYTEVETRIHEAIGGLPEKCQEIFKMSRFSDMTYKEIAETLDIPVRQVHYQIGLALKELRQRLQGLVDQHLLMAFICLSTFF
jgi:RNA polymerase sigma-70 factor (ECF subfamily)